MRIAIVDIDTLTQNWWAVMLRGVAGILFGVLTFLAPHLSLAALVIVYGAYAFADGIFAIVSAIRHRGTGSHWWLLLLVGLVGIAAGVITLLWPGITAIALLYVIAAWALVIGVLEIASAIRLRKAITGEWLLALSGIAAVVFGVLLALFPGPGALAVVLWIGAYALVTGVLLVILGLRLRSWGQSHTPHAATSAA
ncbi:MAG TPA: HdeD family acid-resistance protein [Gemmatimonadaceae bacterium]